jgi:hypothetical protein
MVNGIVLEYSGLTRENAMLTRARQNPVINPTLDLLVFGIDPSPSRAGAPEESQGGAQVKGLEGRPKRGSIEVLFLRALGPNVT